MNLPSILKGLSQRIAEWEFHPEIYVYPTPRMYSRLDSFEFAQLELTQQLNVYVHVPFCRQFCTFCGYFKTIYEETLQERFVDAVVAEIELRRGCLEGKQVTTLHFGGGTPSLLTSEQMARIVSALRRANPSILESCLEVSIEATPESIENEKFADYRQVGINRVSMGVQSLVDEEVRLANRCIEPGRDAVTMLAYAVETLREVGIADVVVDLMIGIEGQTVATFEETLRRTLRLEPDTVQLYALGVMPQTALGRRRPAQLMTGEEIYRCYQLARELFVTGGYRRDSHDRYTRHPINGFLQGDLNIRGMSLIGLGAGARSYASNMHVRNCYSSSNGRKTLLEYMERVTAGRHAVESGLHLDTEERMRGYAIGHLQALHAGQFQERFGQSFDLAFPELVKELRELSLMSWEEPYWRLTERGLLFRDLVGRAFFSARAEQLENAYRP